MGQATLGMLCNLQSRSVIPNVICQGLHLAELLVWNVSLTRSLQSVLTNYLITRWNPMSPSATALLGSLPAVSGDAPISQILGTIPAAAVVVAAFGGLQSDDGNLNKDCIVCCQLFANYSGPVMRLRRTSDNQEIDACPSFMVHTPYSMTASRRQWGIDSTAIGSHTRGVGWW